MTTDEVATLMKGLLAEIRQHTTAEKDDASVNAVKRPAPLIDEFQAHTSTRSRGAGIGRSTQLPGVLWPVADPR